jgi:hypothetical protein
MLITSCAKPLMASPTSVPAASTVEAIFCPAGVHRNTKRLPAANAAALAGSDGTATMSTGAGVVVVAGVGSGAAAMLYPFPYCRDRIAKYHCLLFSFLIWCLLFRRRGSGWRPGSPLTSRYACQSGPRRANRRNLLKPQAVGFYEICDSDLWGRMISCGPIANRPSLRRFPHFWLRFVIFFS